jgi:hypothetical protein
MSLIHKTSLMGTSSLTNIDAGLDFVLSDETEDSYGCCAPSSFKRDLSDDDWQARRTTNIAKGRCFLNGLKPCVGDPQRASRAA